MSIGQAHAEKTREKIKTTQIINRLNKQALGELDNEMTATQLKAAEILLNKTLPNLKQVDHTGKVEFEDKKDPKKLSLEELRQVVGGNVTTIR